MDGCKERRKSRQGRERESTKCRKVGIGKGKKGRDRGQREGMKLERRTKQF